MKPPFITFGIPIGAAAIWNYLEKADVPDIKGVWCYVGGSPPVARRLLSFRSSSATTATRSKESPRSGRAGNYHGRFVIVVDDDIDPSDMKEVIWAVSTRCDPKTAISIIDGCWSTPLDPAMHPDQRDAGNFINSRHPECLPALRMARPLPASECAECGA